jgi:hypothetical protein
MKYTFFAFQAAVRGLGLRAQLHQILAAAPAEQSLIDKREMYGKVTGALLPYVPAMDFGYWDYIADPDRAEKEFDSWVSEIEQTVAAGAPGGGEASGVYRSAAGEYFLVSLAFLLQQGGPSDLVVAERCDIAEQDFFTRATFATLVATPPMLAFATVRADAVYVVPGTDEHALSAGDLRGEGYEYLRPLS